MSALATPVSDHLSDFLLDKLNADPLVSFLPKSVVAHLVEHLAATVTEAESSTMHLYDSLVETVTNHSIGVAMSGPWCQAIASRIIGLLP